MKGKIFTCLSTSEIDHYPISAMRVVVIDIFRASTTICAALSSGISQIQTVASPEEALSIKRKAAKDVLIAAERGGEKVEGFDYGNSPYEYLDKDWNNNELVLTTSNGTRALRLSSKAKNIYVGGFVNMSLLKEQLFQGKGDILLFCAGWKGVPNLEDSFFAGAMVMALLEDYLPVDDNSTICLHMYEQHKKDAVDFLKQSTHYKRLHEKIGDRDMKLALKQDAIPVLPEFSGGYIKVR